MLSLALIGGAGYLGWRAYDQNQKPNNQQTSALSKYNNDELGIRFSYPKEWGEVELQPTYTRSDQPINNDELVFTGYHGVFSSKKDIKFSLHHKTAPDSGEEGGFSPLAYKDWCEDTSKKFRPIIPFTNACNEGELDPRTFSNPELINNGKAIIFDSLEIYTFIDPPNDEVETVGLIIRLDGSEQYPTLSLSAPKTLKGDVRTFGEIFNK